MVLLQIDQQMEKGLSYWGKFQDALISFAPKVVLALVIFIIGKWVIGKISLATKKIFQARSFDPSLQGFLSSLISISMTVALLLIIADIVGISVTGFAALLAGAGIAIGSALNGSLGNLAGGVMILIFKPFKVGDMIEAQGSTGVVTDIKIFNTFVTTAERKTVILPNGALSTGVITNYNTSGSLRVDIPMAISPSMSIEKARQVAIRTMEIHPLVLKNPAPEVVVTKIADGMVTLSLRPSAEQINYPTVFVEIQEMVKNAFDANGIEGPTPHRIIINK